MASLTTSLTVVQKEKRGAPRLNSLIPVFCSSATRNIGVSSMMDMLVSFSPTSANTKDPDAKGMSALVFKTINQEHVGEISYFRVFSGEASSGQDVSNPVRNDSEKLRQIFSSRLSYHQP